MGEGEILQGGNLEVRALLLFLLADDRVARGAYSREHDIMTARVDQSEYLARTNKGCDQRHEERWPFMGGGIVIK